MEREEKTYNKAWLLAIWKKERFKNHFDLGAFNNYVDKMKGGGGQKMSVFVHTQDLKTVHAGKGGGEVKEWQNYVHVVFECPPNTRIVP